ncbi:unnamed protein product [Durusdinium trenchii]|uniref:Uncharacterized protein n=1 Tax=Durusdinium trenchii TaxID=1381693 RepID=A0ABP0PGI4_9DINO
MNDILDTAATSGPREQADLRFARATVSPAAMAPRRSGSQALPGELVFHPCVPEHMECSTQVELSESEVEDEDPEPKSTGSKVKRDIKRQVQAQILQTFLKKHKFKQDVNQRKRSSGGCLLFRPSEEFCPIHLAAKTGDLSVLRVLLRAGADLHARSSRGRTALDLAREADVCGSHAQAVPGGRGAGPGFLLKNDDLERR